MGLINAHDYENIVSKNNFSEMEIKTKICINLFGLTDPIPI